jgi:hypothetical protein
MAAPATVRAVTSFQCELRGVTYVVHAGDVFATTARIVKEHPELFKPVVPVETRSVEAR